MVGVPSAAYRRVSSGYSEDSARTLTALLSARIEDTFDASFAKASQAGQPSAAMTRTSGLEAARAWAAAALGSLPQPAIVAPCAVLTASPLSELALKNAP